MKLLIIISLVTLLCGNCVRCARILGVFPFAGKSHYMPGETLMRGLAEAGHDVTMISPFKNEEPVKKGRYRDVQLTGVMEEFQNKLKNVNLMDDQAKFSFNTMFVMIKSLFDLNHSLFNHTNVKKLLASDEKFDVVIVEQFVTDTAYIFAHHYGAPLIVFSPARVGSWVNSMVGNPTPVAYVPQAFTSYSPKMSFLQRVKNTLLYVFVELVYKLYILPSHNEVVKRYFDDPPLISDLFYNVSLVLINTHESYDQPVPLVPNMVLIGGFHVKPPRKLPQDLQQFLDNATDGAIYFSMGSHLLSKNMPAVKRDALLKAFGKLKQKVLWKWEDDVLPGQPPNVKLGKWLPQQDILAHPNVKLFVTHGGMSSTTETVYHGQPILAIPVGADQYMNSQACVANGFALILSYSDPDFSDERLSILLEELLHNPKYTENIKKISRRFHDRPLTPMQNAVYWVEYVIRHKGAPHLRVAGVDLPWYQYLLLDVVAFVAVVSLLTFTLLWLGIRKFVRFIRARLSKKVKTKTN